MTTTSVVKCKEATCRRCSKSSNAETGQVSSPPACQAAVERPFHVPCSRAVLPLALSGRRYEQRLTRALPLVCDLRTSC